MAIGTTGAFRIPLEPSSIVQFTGGKFLFFSSSTLAPMFSSHTLPRLHSVRLLIALALLTLTSCAKPVQLEQAPTGENPLSVVRESYLIPPEIPATLLDYLFRKIPGESEIVSITVTDHSTDSWTLEITREELPNRSIVERRRFLMIDGEWFER